MIQKKSPEQVEKALNALFEKYKIQEKINVGMVKKWIWNAKGEGMEPVNRYQKKCFQLFPEPEDIDELNNIMQIFVDAWNYFPHRELGGKAPCDLFDEYSKNAPEEDEGERAMPKVCVGGAEMDWGDYKQILEEMEKMQKPFKKWIEDDALPKYKKYLEQLVKNKKRQEEYYNVAEVFFDRALHVGFIELAKIRSAFVQEEFPQWWPTHILYSNLKPAQVKKSLERFFMFTELVYKIDKGKYGF